MQKKRFLLVCIASTILALSGSAMAELQNVTVGGQIRIRGNYWLGSFNPGNGPVLVGPEVRIPARLLRPRAIGDALGGQNAVSHFDWDTDRSDYAVVEQRTTLNVRADFTAHVSAFIELESFDVWGEDFRSANYITGVDTRAAAGDDIEVYQAYIEADEIFGQPIRARIGRQELSFGSGWLIGNSSNMPEFRGLSFDAIRLTYAPDPFAIDAFYAKLMDRVGIEEDGDVDLYGIYAACTYVENMTFDAYWFWVRDARSIEDVDGSILTDWFEEAWGVDDYDATNLHTVGLRAAGEVSGFDFEAEIAYQFGEADQAGALFKGTRYGDDGADFDAWGAHLDAGYTIDIPWQPRVSLRAAYFDGEDNRDIDLQGWLNPFHKPTASISFNRLFSNTVYSYFFDEMAQLSNAWTAGAGVQVTPLECLEFKLSAAYFGVVAPFDMPRSASIFGHNRPIAGPFTFWTEKGHSDLGWDLSLSGVYHYSDDLDFEAGWSHLFTGKGLTEGAYTDFNGLLFTGGIDEEDADYFYLQTRIAF